MSNDDRIRKGAGVWGRGRAEKGLATGGTRMCGMEGCRGIRVGVRWPDGKITYPCTHGMKPYRGRSMQII